MQNSDTKFEKYLTSVAERGYTNLKPTKHIVSLSDLVTEGRALLNSENVPVDPPKMLNTALGENSSNPYAKSRIKVLDSMPITRRERILESEKTGNINTPEYNAFVKAQAKLAEEFYKESSTP
jgi:hypothetical protein